MSRIKDYQAIAHLKMTYIYDPDTGIFLRRTTRKQAGTLASTGYRYINILHHPRAEHRLAWAFMTGTFPDGDIDHIDRDRSNNRWANLREVTRQQNCWNSKQHMDSNSPYKGVTRIKGAKAKPWKAQIYDNGKQICLGHFISPEEAQAAYSIAAYALRGEYACLG